MTTRQQIFLPPPPPPQTITAHRRQASPPPPSPPRAGGDAGSRRRARKGKKGGFGVLVLSILAFAAVAAGLAWGIDALSSRAAGGSGAPTTPGNGKPPERQAQAPQPSGKPAPGDDANQTVPVAGPVIPEDTDIPEGQRVYVARDGKLEPRRASDVEKFGYFVIDLGDEAVPFIFSQTDGAPNRYRQTFLDIANDRTDERGEPMAAGRHNYVELFGIPPSLSVLAGRFREDEQRKCYGKIDVDFFRKTRLSVTYEGKRSVKDEIDEVQAELERAKKKTGKTVDQLAKTNEYALLVRKHKNISGKMAMVTEVQKRLQCEGLLESYTPGVITHSTVKAIRDFEHKHMIFGYGILTGDTRAGFGRTPLQNNFATLRRVLEARVTWSMGIIEDGSVNGKKDLPDTWKDRDGKEHKVRNLVDEYTTLLMKEMGVETPEKAREFFLAIEPQRFAALRVAFAGPPLPEYYRSDMDFSVVVDRGDVYYDAPLDATGKQRFQPVSRRPSNTLYLEYEGQKIPLVRYGTTIGGWRREFKDGKEYLAYKGSDVGAHVWKDIYAAPVWIPPASTPPSSLLKSERVDGKWVTRVHTEEMGPSYASAYGLVAAIHIRNRDANGRAVWQDNGIRSHGSVDYMSIQRSFSHGCHRLHNHLAIRLFSFILHHRDHERLGQTKMRYQKRFTVNKRDYSVTIDTRGYQFSLARAIPVMVEPGRILGKLEEPFRGYLPVPGHTYDPDDPNLREKPASDAATDPADRAGGGAAPEPAETGEEPDLPALPPPPKPR